MAKQKTTKQIKADLETRTVRIGILEEGLSVRQFAALCKMPAHLLSDSLTKNFPYQLTRYRVEAAFRYRRPIWSDLQTLELRLCCVKRLGFDPYLVGVRVLRRLAKDAGADFSLCTGKSSMIREVLARAAIPEKTSTTGKT